MNHADIPRALELLAAQKNPAADAALVEALPRMTPSAQEAALELLSHRDHRPSLTSLVARFATYDESFKALLGRSATKLLAGLRGAIASGELADRLAAIELATRSDDSRLVFLLADGVRSSCARTRAHASEALCEVTRSFVDRSDNEMDSGGASANQATAKRLAEALSRAVQGWELHAQPKVLEAALWMGEWVEDAVRSKLTEPRSRIGHALNELVSRASDPRMADFLLRALGFPELRAAAARAIGDAAGAELRGALADASWLLADREMEREFRRVRNSAWLHDGLDELVQLGPGRCARTARMIEASGASEERRVEQLKALVREGDPPVARAATWALVANDSAESTRVLSLLSVEPDGDSGRIAARELRLRRWRKNGPGVAPAPEGPGDAFEHFFNDFSEGEDATGDRSCDPFATAEADALARLQSKLGSADSDVRLRSLRIVRALQLAPKLAETIFKLANDVDGPVRSLAIRLLGEIGGPVSARLLRGALNDPDERVQANAIEALAQLALPDQGHLAISKLASKNSRVRANAIHALLGIELREAGEALLDMLEDPSRDHRLSALWVVERMELHVLLHRIVDLSHHDPDLKVRARARRVLARLVSIQTSSRRATPPSARHPVHAPGTEARP